MNRALFKDIPRTVDTAVRIVGYVGGAITITKVARDMTTSLPGQREFTIYIFVSYFTTVIGLAAAAVIARHVWQSRTDSESQRASVSLIHHKLAEVVRRYASGAIGKSANDNLLKSDVDLHFVAEKLVEFVKMRLGRRDVSVVVKHLGGNAGARVITAAFRHPHPDVTSQRPETMCAEDSVVYMDFLEGNTQIQKVIIRDVQQLDTDPQAGAVKAARNLAYQQHAKKCGFRSVLAFPLRQPKSSDGELAANTILGFLSLDCPEVNAFDELFLPGTGPDTNDGRHLKDSSDMQFFFGVADSMATLAVLGAK